MPTNHESTSASGDPNGFAAAMAEAPDFQTHLAAQASVPAETTSASTETAKPISEIREQETKPRLTERFKEVIKRILSKTPLANLVKDRNERELNQIDAIMEQIESFRNDYHELSEEALQGKTAEFRDRLQNGETLDQLLPEAYAAVREASRRVLGMEHFSSQLRGGIALHQGRIAEMQTGEGKTITAMLPAYLNALTGKGVHIVTSNEYLAERDCAQTNQVLEFMGMHAGFVAQRGMSDEAKHAAYNADVTYGTNSAFGFDYLRDNIATDPSKQFQRGHAFAIVDEVDSVLLDEGQTPLVLSKGETGEKGQPDHSFADADAFVHELRQPLRIPEGANEIDWSNIDTDCYIDEKTHDIVLTDRGLEKMVAKFNINYQTGKNIGMEARVQQALRANYIMQQGVNYDVQPDPKTGEPKVFIIDQLTGRFKFGSSFGDGLHQALEAKHAANGVKVHQNIPDAASITVQNYYRQYGKLSGMTGTGASERQEFADIYNLDVVEIPPHKGKTRVDQPDVLFKNEQDKQTAILKQVQECLAKGQPILIGTASVASSEQLSQVLEQAGIPHSVLNAVNHKEEADIISQAGRPGTVTISTNMAGRGTDIKLGGSAEKLAEKDIADLCTPEELQEVLGEGEPSNEKIANLRLRYDLALSLRSAECKRDGKKVREAGGLFVLGTEYSPSQRVDDQLRGRAGRQGDPGQSRFFVALTDKQSREYLGDRLQATLDSVPDDHQPVTDVKLRRQAKLAQRAQESSASAARRRAVEYDDVIAPQREIIFRERQEVLDGADLTATLTKMIQENAPDQVSALATNLNSPENRTAFLKMLDTKWVAYTNSTKDLRQNSGLRAYAQEDPLDQFRRECVSAYDQMLSDLGSDFTAYLLQKQEQPAPAQPPAAELPVAA